MLPGDVIDAAASTWHAAAENELALRYGISLSDDRRHSGAFIPLALMTR